MFFMVSPQHFVGRRSDAVVRTLARQPLDLVKTTRGIAVRHAMLATHQEPILRSDIWNVYKMPHWFPPRLAQSKLDRPVFWPCCERGDRRCRSHFIRIHSFA
jgi:hypothetical protein